MVHNIFAWSHPLCLRHACIAWVIRAKLKKSKVVRGNDEWYEVVMERINYYGDDNYSLPS